MNFLKRLIRFFYCSHKNAVYYKAGTIFETPKCVREHGGPVLFKQGFWECPDCGRVIWDD